jgi:methylglutaconyl-CoA hydratase
MMSDAVVIREDHGAVTLLVLNRPDRRNALSRTLMADLGDALTQLACEAKVRCVVLTGAGPTFCAGMDLKEAEIAARGTEAEEAAIADVQAISDVIQQLHTFEKPTIAALNGDAYAGGAGLALACDFIIASMASKIGYPEVRRGLVAAVVMHDLVHQIGERRARALLLSGESIDASAAERWGLVNRVVAPELCRSVALALAGSLVACGPHALAATKRLLDEVSGRPRNLRGPAAVTAAVRVSDEAIEGMRAFLERRRPSWAD